MSQTIETSIAAPAADNASKSITGYFADKKNAAAAVTISVAIGALFTWLIIGHKIGINYFALALVLISAAGYVMYKDNNLNIGKYAFWAVCFLAGASLFFRLQNEIYTVLAILTLPPLFVAATVFSGKKMPQNIIVNAIIRFVGSIAFVDKIFAAMKFISKKNEGSKKTAALKVAAGIAISFVLLLMILPLMFSADVLFKNAVLDIVDLTKISEVLWKTVLSAAVAILFFGFLYIITVKKDVPEKNILLFEKKYNVETVLLIVLCAVGAVYAAFAVIQFGYLFGGVKSGLPQDMNLAEYARSGYFEQIAMTVINAAIIGLSVFFTEKSEGRQKTAVNILLVYFIAVNFYLLISSAYKMNLYQREYGFTVLRLLVDMLIIFESLALIMMAAKVLRRKLRYLMFLVYFTAAFWAAASFINIEGLAAELNIARYEKEGKIDVAYLTELDDVSAQLKYLYLNHYDSLESEDIQKIEQYFFEDGRNGYEYSEDKKVNTAKPIEFNISRYKRANDADEILRSKSLE